MRVLSFLLLISSGILAQTPTVTCAGGINGVQEGQSITCASTTPVTWSLTGTGTLSGATGTSVTYTAPASITPQHVMAGCPVMPNDSIFNTRIDNLPVDSRSAGWVPAVAFGDSTANVGFGETSWGVSTSTATTPITTLGGYYGGTTTGFPLSTGFALKREDGSYQSRRDNQDHHVVNVRTDICEFFEVYNQHALTDPEGLMCNGGVGTGCNAQGSISFNWGDYATNGGLAGTDAAGLPLSPLSLHLSDFYNGAINHALRFTTGLGDISHNGILWPASVSNGATSGWPGAEPPYMGARFRLRLCGGGITTNCLTLSTFTPYQQILLTGLHNYGMILADIGSRTSVTSNTDLVEDQAVLCAITGVTGVAGCGMYVPIGDFEVVDETSLQAAAGSYATCPFNKTCVGAQNTYENPLNQAVIVATPIGSGSAVSTPIAIQGVSIYLTSPNITIEAAPFSYQIPSQVNGTANQGVTWTLVSGVGSVTSGGIYTPPLQAYYLFTNTSQFELGTRIQSDIDGYFTGCRFFKPATGDTGTHTCTVWDDSGTLLKTATFSGETASGWQSQNFGSALAITANTPYWISYNTSGNIYVSQPFDYPLANGTMHALQSVPGHPNGRYFMGSGFPNTTNYASGYTGDVIFSTSPSGTSPLSIYTFTAAGSSAMLKVTSTADSNAVAYEGVNIAAHSAINDDGSPSLTANSSVRVDSGNYSGFTVDSNGAGWQPEIGLEFDSPGCCGQDTHPGWQTTPDPELPIYETAGYGNGATGDFQYTFIVPNGNYRVKAMYGAVTGPVQGEGWTSAMYINGGGPGARLHLETQGNLVLHNWNHFLAQPPGYAWISRTPAFAYVPAKVTNNVLQFASRAVFYDMDIPSGAGTNCGSCFGNQINGIRIIPDSTPPHWAIDDQQQATVAAGASFWTLTNASAQTEYGTLFLSKLAGYVTGCGFYKPAGETGIHTCTLWQVVGQPGGTNFGSQVGTSLGSATFSGETASGWQSQNFSSAIPISANTSYVISYNTTTGMTYYAPLVTPAHLYQRANLEDYGSNQVSGSGTYPQSIALHGGILASYTVQPIFSLSSSGTNPVTLFPAGGLPGQQAQFYLQDWYTGLNDPTWSILSGPGTIEANTDTNENPFLIYSAPSTQPIAGTGTVIQAKSASNPAISTTATLRFTGTEWTVK